MLESQNGLLILELITYSLALWLGLYLIARNPASLRLRYAGLGIVAYAFALGAGLLAARAPAPETSLLWTRLHWPALFLPAVLWFMAMVYLLPDDSPLRTPVWQYIFLIMAVLFYLLSSGTDWVFDFSQATPQAGPAYLLFAGAVLLPLLVALTLIGRAFYRDPGQRALGLLLVAAIFFGLGAVLLLLPLGWLPRRWLILGISLDFVILGLVIALLDAFDQGERLLPDLVRSLDAALFGTLIFGGLVGLTIWLGTGLTFPMLLLLVGTLTAAIAGQVLADPVQSLIDRVALAAWPHLRQERAGLRAATSALPRLAGALALDQLDEAQFARLIRRALSDLGDLPRLAASPLTRLPLIDHRLARREARDDTLERAAELKALLTGSIERLKPREQGEFGSTDEWRYYNALYFPYVAGLKPYSRRADYSYNGLSPAEHEALEWFRTCVPERTLYNWQNTGAKLVAQDLWERIEEEIGRLGD